MVICPKCGGKNTVEIIYGMPSPELIGKEKQDLVKLGGCRVDPNNPKWFCNDCKNEF